MAANLSGSKEATGPAGGRGSHITKISKARDRAVSPPRGADQHARQRPKPLIERIPMSHVTIMNRSQLFPAATAISAVGFLAVPAPAHAGPMFPLPLAPPCNQYAFVGDFSIRQDDGWQVFFSSTGPAA